MKAAWVVTALLLAVVLAALAVLWWPRGPSCQRVQTWRPDERTTIVQRESVRCP